jgi:hypothetical protein
MMSHEISGFAKSRWRRAPAVCENSFRSGAFWIGADVAWLTKSAAANTTHKRNRSRANGSVKTGRVDMEGFTTGTTSLLPLVGNRLCDLSSQVSFFNAL